MRKINFNKLKEFLVIVGETLLITTITVFSVAPVSCRITTQGIQLLTGDYTPPQLLDYEVLDSTSIRLYFSEKVQLTGQVVSPVLAEAGSEDDDIQTFDLPSQMVAASGAEGMLDSHPVYYEDASYLDIFCSENMEIGKQYQLYGCVKDATGNTLTFAVPFSGFNPRVPGLLMTEIKTISDTSQNKAEKEAGFYRNEYIEILCLSDGNLAGLELCSANDGEARKYTFPILEVHKGELINVHLRLRGEGCVSEEGDDLTLATTTYTNPEIRDLWGTDTGTLLGNKTDIIIIRNKATSALVDAVMYRDETVTEWSSKLVPYSLLIDESGIYDSGDIEQASISTGLTGTKNLYRIDAYKIQEELLKGNSIGFPVKANPDSWAVGTASAGILETL